MSPKVERGDRVEMTGLMVNDPCPMPVGSKGTVLGVVGTEEFPQIDVDWDDAGRSLYLLPDDPFRVINRVEYLR